MVVGTPEQAGAAAAALGQAAAPAAGLRQAGQASAPGRAGAAATALGLTHGGACDAGGCEERDGGRGGKCAGSGYDASPTSNFWRGRRVLVTGDTGFKGSWLVRILAGMGAAVCGYALAPPTEPSLYAIAGIADVAEHIDGDVRDYDCLLGTIERVQPEVVLHLAAQPIVLDGYREPRYTYDVNVMGTVNVLEAARAAGCVRSIVNVTTDKVYLNEERPGYGYVEADRLDGFDPYSNSKSCSELVTATYARSFLTEAGCAVSTARAGNVIGGGDFAPDRIIPDCVRAAAAGHALIVRNPASTRPYQHVLEPLFAYLTIAERQWENPSCAGAYNVGPNESDCVTTGELVELFARAWDARGGDGFSWEDASSARTDAPHEAAFLKLDSTKMTETFGWQPQWSIAEAVDKTVAWSRVWLAGGDVRALMDRQIAAYAAGLPLGAPSGAGA